METKRTRKLLTRRNVLRTLGAGAIATTGLVGWTIGIEPHWVEVVENDLPLRGLSPSLDGKRLVQITDLHHGPTDLAYLVEVCEKVNALKPDLIAITGDLIDHHHPQSVADVATMLRALNPAPLGAFAVLGNHDYGHRWNDLALGQRVAATLEGGGVRVLSGETVEIEGLKIVGLDDLWGPRFEGWRALRDFDDSREALCLCHNPDACDLDFWQAFRGTTLCGHTHGGQCKPLFLPPPMLPVQNRNYVAGFYQAAPGRRLYISRGVGHLTRARFNCRPEISHFTLRAA